MKTIKGIYLDLNESEYKISVSGLVFYFSSQFYLDKFSKNVKEFIKEETIKINVKYKVNIDLTIYLMIAFYKKIEKRGFRIYDKVNDKELSENANFIQTLTEY